MDFSERSACGRILKLIDDVLTPASRISIPKQRKFKNSYNKEVTKALTRTKVLDARDGMHKEALERITQARAKEIAKHNCATGVANATFCLGDWVILANFKKDRTKLSDCW